MMRYSLLSRFQGAWLGSAIGEAFTKNSEQADWLKILNYQPSKLTIAGINIARIINNCGQLKQLDWQKVIAQQELEELDPNSQEIVLLILPIVLFCHESFSLLREQLQKLAQLCPHTAEVLDDILVWGYAIALALRGKLEVTESVEPIILSLGEHNTFLVKQFQQASILLSQGEGLQQVVEELSQQGNSIQAAISIAWYCFQSTPEDFSVCVRRAMSIEEQTTTTIIMTGALAGAYNSLTGIPLNWRLASQNNPVYQEIDQQAKYLLDSWAGRYQPNPVKNSSSVFTSAGILQPRPSLKIVSQRGND